MIPDYTESNFAGIEHGDGISAIRFHAPWCELCRRSGQEFACISGPQPASVFTQAVHNALLSHDRDVVINLFHIL